MATPFQCTFFISKLLKSFKKAIKSCLWLPDKMWAFFGPNMTHNYSAPSVLDKACVHICLSSSCFSTKRFSHCMNYKQTCGKYKSKILIQNSYVHSNSTKKKSCTLMQPTLPTPPPPSVRVRYIFTKVIMHTQLLDALLFFSDHTRMSHLCSSDHAHTNFSFIYFREFNFLS